VKKVMVIGCSGAGKSVFSRRLGAITGLPVIHLDQHHWRPGWVDPPKDVWRDQLAELLDRAAWIMDGNFGSTMEMRLAHCDTAIFLDFPRHVCTWRVLKRALTYRGTTRPDLAPGCPEKIDLPFLKWVWDFPKRSRHHVLERLSRVADRISIVKLHNDRETDEFLASVGSV
jgi:adenylate kinase family enzyme